MAGDQRPPLPQTPPVDLEPPSIERRLNHAGSNGLLGWLGVEDTVNKNNSGENSNKDSTTDREGRTRRRTRPRGKKKRAAQARTRQKRRTTILPQEDAGDEIAPKRQGNARIIHCNADSFPAVTINNHKVNETKRFARKVDADYLSFTEAGVNWTSMPKAGSPYEQFRTENALRVATAHNEHENFGRKQQGGCMALALGQMATKATEVDRDETGLGRWCWMSFQGKGGIVTKIITAYRPCKAKRETIGAVYNQHARYFEQRGDRTCPKKLFDRDLGSLLKKWRDNKDRIILMIDANDDLDGHNRFTTMMEDLDMREVVRAKHPDLPRIPTFKRGDRTGSNQIDGVFATSDIRIDTGTWLAFHKFIGDHRTAVIDIPWKVLLGEDMLKIVRPQARRLSCNIPKAKNRYEQKFLEQAKDHKILPKLHAVYKRANGPLSPEQKEEMERIDHVRKELMIAAEKRCRKLCMGEIDFSPEVSIAGKRYGLWKLIVKKKQGRRVSSSLIKRRARA